MNLVRTYGALVKEYDRGRVITFVGCYTRPSEAAEHILVEAMPLPGGYEPMFHGEPSVGDLLEWSDLDDHSATGDPCFELMEVVTKKPDGHRLYLGVTRGVRGTKPQSIRVGDSLIIHRKKDVPPSA